jgi:type IV pilus assembly protein PilB
MARKRKKLGEILLEWGTVTQSQIDQAMGLAKGSGKRLGEALVEAGFCKEEEVAKALATQFDMEYIDLDAPHASDKIDMSLISDDLIRKHLILPMSRNGGRMKLIIHDPMDLELLDLLRFRLNSEIETSVSAKTSIKEFIDGQFRGSSGGRPSMFSDESLVTDSVDVTSTTPAM